MISDIDFEIIEKCNSYGLSVSLDEYVLSSDGIHSVNAVNRMECVFVDRINKEYPNGDMNKVISDLYGLSLALQFFDVDAAVRYRRYSYMFRHIDKLLKNSVIFDCHYLVDNACGECGSYAGVLLDLEQEAANPTFPLESCQSANKMCPVTPLYEVRRNDEGVPIRHGKDYFDLLTITISKY